MTTDDVRARLLKMADRAGGQRALARDLGVSPSYLNDVLRRDKEPAGKLIEALGLRRVVRYERVA